MKEIEFIPLCDVREEELIDLMNNEAVVRHLPLLDGIFSAEQCQAFLDAKKKLWDAYGYGPHGFLVNGKFAGWGGLQPEQGEADFALVLHPDFWGWGLKIFKQVKEEAFGVMKLPSITILLPPDRPNSKAVRRLGFIPEEPVTVGGEAFLKFRLHNPE